MLHQSPLADAWFGLLGWRACDSMVEVFWASGKAYIKAGLAQCAYD